MAKAYLTEFDRITKRRNDANKALKPLVNYKMELYGINSRQVAAQMGIGYTTFLNKLKAPESFSIREFRDLCYILHFSDEEIASFMLIDGNKKAAV